MQEITPMKKLMAALAMTTLMASPTFAATRPHYSQILPPPHGWTWHHLRPGGTTWHDAWHWGSPPVRTGSFALAQDGEHYAPVDSYDVVLDGRIVGRDPDPNIRFQLLREAGFPPH
jgi:hypothetical protein